MPRRRAVTVALVSLGCPKNLVDSEKLLAHLAEGGCVVGAPMDEAEVIVVNTCGFLEAARRESLEAIAEAVGQKRRGRARRVVVAGCLASRDGRELYAAVPGIDALVGVGSRADILAAVTGRGRCTRLAPPEGGELDDAGRFRLTPRHTAYLRIADGCAQRCSFCTIPSIRGALRSKPLEAVLAEARELAADGAVELNVIAQDTTGYGLDLRPRAGLAPLLRELGRLDGVRWIRLMYAYPKRFTRDLIAVLADGGRVVPYVDLPLQHVADGVLRRMRRGVTRKGIEKLLGELRGRVRGVAIRTTFLVGFPGETDADFAELLAFVKDFGFEAMGVFEFSPEPGTEAASMAPAVPDDVKAARAEALMLAQQEIAFRHNRNMIGTPIEVLVDAAGAEGRCRGRHRGQAPEVDGVCHVAPPAEPGTFVAGTVTGFDGYDLLVDAQDHAVDPSE